MNTDMAAVNKLLMAAASMVNDDTAAPYSGPCKVGIDLGTADIQTVVLDASNQPLACYLEWSEAVRDGVVVDFHGASRIVREQVMRACQRLSIQIERATTSFPPGTDARISTNVVEAAGIDVSGVIDEPSSVAALLQLDQAAVVDIGGGTTGTAIIERREVVKSIDDATGGHHMTLTVAGHLSMPYEDAERLKRSDKTGKVLGIVQPVIEKMADLVKRHIAGYAPPAIYLTGGCCALHGFAERFAAEFNDVEVIFPAQPLFLTPLAIAAYTDSARNRIS